jgi:hypothetical protein
VDTCHCVFKVMSNPHVRTLGKCWVEKGFYKKIVGEDVTERSIN